MFETGTSALPRVALANAPQKQSPPEIRVGKPATKRSLKQTSPRAAMGGGRVRARWRNLRRDALPSPSSRRRSARRFTAFRANASSHGPDGERPQGRTFSVRREAHPRASRVAPPQVLGWLSSEGTQSLSFFALASNVALSDGERLGRPTTTPMAMEHWTQ